MSPSRLISLAAVLLAVGCGHLDVLQLDPTPRSPTDPHTVRLLAQEPEQPYTVIALVAVTEGDLSADARTRLLKAAARLGGDAVLLGTGSLTRVGTGGEGGTARQLSGKVIVFTRTPAGSVP